MIQQLGRHWLGWEFWYLGVKLRIPPCDLRRWSRDQILETYYHLRLRDLKEPAI